MLRYSATLLLLILILFSCRPDPKLPNWDIEALTPIASTRLEISDIFQDSSLKSDGDGHLSIIYQHQLANILPSEIISPLNADFRNTVKLSTIDLGNPKIKDAISLGFLCKSGNPAGQFIMYNNGKTAIIPGFTTTNKKSFTVDGSHLFQTLDLISGDLKLEFFNDLPVMLTDLQFDLQNKISGTTLLQKTLDTLRPGETYSETFPLDGKTIEGQLLTTLRNLGTPGSGTDSIVIDTSRKIFISVSLNDLVPSSATAVFPDQVLANDTTDTEIKAGRAQLTGIRVKEGSIYLEAMSTIEDKISLNYLVPSARKNNSPLSFSESVPPAPPSGQSSISKSIDLNGYDLNLTGRPWDAGIYNSFFTVLKGKIDSSGNLIHLSLQDSLQLNTGIRNLKASRGFGYLGKDTSTVNEVTAVNIFGNIKPGLIDLEEVRLLLEFKNSIGAPLSVVVSELLANSTTQGSVLPSNSTSLQWNDLGKLHDIPAATLSPLNSPLASFSSIALNRSNSNLDELLEVNPRRFKSSMSSYINYNSSVPDFQQFIFADRGLEAFLSLEIPMSFSGQDIQLYDTLKFDYYDLDKKGQLQHGELKLIGNNHFPLSANVTIYMQNARGEILGSLESNDILKAAPVNSDGRAIAEEKSIASYPLPSSAVPLLKESSHLILQVKLATAGSGFIRLYDSDYLNLTLAGDLMLRTTR